MLRCPKCRRRFEDKRYCPEHGIPLVRMDTIGVGQRNLMGQVVGGKYRILDRIGEGGMGEVYKVEHVALGKPLAMKILHRDLSVHEQAVLRFEREAKAASQLVHPHIILVSDFGVAADGSLYIVMEFLEGRDLFDELKEVRYMNAKRTVDIMRQVCSGLAEAHRHGVIHRDLKPETIFLAQGREYPDFVKILDFGIAKVLEPGPDERTLTASGTVFGTPEYLSPEQAAGGEIDHRADLYSLGIIMYRMVTGRLPFVGGNKSGLIQRQLYEMPVPFSERRMPQQVPPSLEKVIFKLLAKDPDDRYQDALQLKEALERVDTRPYELQQQDPDDETPTDWLVFPEKGIPGASNTRAEQPPQAHVPQGSGSRGGKGSSQAHMRSTPPRARPMHQTDPSIQAPGSHGMVRTMTPFSPRYALMVLILVLGLALASWLIIQIMGT